MPRRKRKLTPEEFVARMHAADLRYRKRRRRRLLAKGLCPRCVSKRRPVVEGTTSCAECRDKANAVQARLRARRAKHRICRDCGKPMGAGKMRRCRGCRDKNNEKQRAEYARRRREGLCTRCGAASDGRSECASCRGRR